MQRNDEHATSNLVTDMAKKLNDLKGFEAGYGNPKKGKMIVNHNGVNFIIRVEPVQCGSIEDAMKEYDFIFRN